MKVSLLSISSVCYFCFFSHSAVCSEFMLCFPPAEKHKASCSFSYDFSFCFLKYQYQSVPSHSALGIILPIQGHFCSSSPCQHPVSQETSCSQAVSKEDASAARALRPVQDPFCLASLGNHMGKAVVTAS